MIPECPSNLRRTAKELQMKDGIPIRVGLFKKKKIPPIQTYKTLLTTMKKQQLPMTMLLKLTKKALHEDTTPPEVSPEEL